MPDYSPNGSFDILSLTTPCSTCGVACSDWMPNCPRCGHAMQEAQNAARIEQGHVAYLLAQLAWWRSRSLLAPPLADRLENDYRQRQQALEAELLRLASPLPAPPVLPPLPERPVLSTRNPSAEDRVSPPFPPQTAMGTPPPLPAMPQMQPVGTVSSLPPARTWEKVLLSFLQTHTLKLIFALATLLVLFALRSMIAWDTVGAIAIRLVPLVPIALTAMFWLFGERTREENLWAAFVYHGMAAVSISFDIAAVNRYWLEAFGLGLGLKPALLLAGLSSTLTAGGMMWRHRRLPYLHLFQTGALLTLYAGLQQVRLLLWNQNDFRAAPLALFGGAYLLLAGLNFALANRALRGSFHSVSEQSAPGTDSTEPKEWAAALTLWAHLSASAVVLLSFLNVVLEQKASLHNFAILALLGSILYAAASQMLEERRMVSVSGALALTACVVWLADSYSLLWFHFGFLLMAISSAALALAAYNASRTPHSAQKRTEATGSDTPRSGESAGVQAAPMDSGTMETGAEQPSSSLALAQAWRQVAHIEVFLAAILVGYQILARWAGMTVRMVPVEEALTGAAQAVLAGLFLVVLARQERRSESVYGGLTAWGLALISLLEGVRAPLGGYALTLMLYGVALWAFSRLLDAPQRAADSIASPPPGPDRSAIPMPSLYKTASAQGKEWPGAEPFAISGHLAAGLGLLLAALLPLSGLRSAWSWSAATLLLGSAFYAFIAQQQRSTLAVYAWIAEITTGSRFAEEKQPTLAVYASLTCLAYANILVSWRLLPGSSLAALLAPFTLTTALAALLLSARLSRTAPASLSDPAGDTPLVLPQNPTEHWSHWRDPLTVMSLFAILLTLCSGLSLLLIGPPMSQPSLSMLPAFSLLPALIASLLLALARGEKVQDLLRSLAVVMGNVTMALEIAVLCRLDGGAIHWTVPDLHRACIGWLLQGGLLWLAGRLLPQLRKTETWSADLVGNGLATAFGAALILMLAVLASPHAAHSIPIGFVMTGAFLLMMVDTYSSGRSVSRRLSLLLVVMAAVTRVVSFSSADGFPATGWTMFSLLAIGGYLLLAHHEQENQLSYNALLPLTLGYGLFIFWKGTSSLPVLDRQIAEACWLAGGIGAGWFYLRAAKQSRQRAFAALAALLFLGTYRHAAALVFQSQAPWEALLLLPMLMALSVYGLYREKEEEFVGRPFQQMALTVSGLALLWSTLAGDGLLSWQAGVNEGGWWSLASAAMPVVVTWTLAAYGLAYSALACYRRTPSTIGVGASTLTAAYLHALLTRTALWHSLPLLSWSQVAFLALPAGFAWLCLGGLLQRRLKRSDLAQPLLGLTAGIALASALLTVLTGHADDWSLLTLACAGALWLGLWRLDCGDIAWHLGAWNLLAFWYVMIRLHLEYDSAQLDLYLLPVGLYLLITGHWASGRKRTAEARMVWWLGLLTILGPAFLAYWNHAPGLHAVLLLVECVLAVGWGILRHIRSYVSAGLIFAVALTTSAILGHLPDYAATLLALVIGVGLFIAGFYGLTHQDRLKQWAVLLNIRWQAWQSWR